MNDSSRREWVLNDEGLYDMQRRSGLSMTKFIRQNRGTIDCCAANVTGGNQPAHYLKYGNSQGLTGRAGQSLQPR